MNEKFTGPMAEDKTKPRFVMRKNGYPGPKCKCWEQKVLNSLLTYPTILALIDAVRGTASSLELCYEAKTFFYAIMVLSFISDLTPGTPKADGGGKLWKDKEKVGKIHYAQIEMMEVFFDAVRELQKTSFATMKEV